MIFLFLFFYLSRNSWVLDIRVYCMKTKLFLLLLKSMSFHSFHDLIYRIIMIDPGSSKLFSNFIQFALKNELTVWWFIYIQNFQKVFEESLILTDLLDRMHTIGILLLYSFMLIPLLLYLQYFFQWIFILYFSFSSLTFPVFFSLIPYYQISNPHFFIFTIFCYLFELCFLD